MQAYSSNSNSNSSKDLSDVFLLQTILILDTTMVRMGILPVEMADALMTIEDLYTLGKRSLSLAASKLMLL